MGRVTYASLLDVCLRLSAAVISVSPSRQDAFGPTERVERQYFAWLDCCYLESVLDVFSRFALCALQIGTGTYLGTLVCRVYRYTTSYSTKYIRNLVSAAAAVGR